MLTWKELKFDDNLKKAVVAVYDGNREIITYEINWNTIWSVYNPIEDGTPEEHVNNCYYDEDIIYDLETINYHDKKGYNVSSLAKEIVNYYLPIIIKDAPKLAYQIEINNNPYTYLNKGPICFKSETDFISFTIKWALDGIFIYPDGNECVSIVKLDSKEIYSAMTGYGFAEVIDKRDYQDGRQQAARWQGDVDTCINFWEKVMHWKVKRIA